MDRIPLYRPYLIQRCDTDILDSKQPRLKSLLNYDYMGSAEFEFGAIPGSLARMRIRIIEQGKDAYVILPCGPQAALGPYVGKQLMALVSKEKADNEQWLADFHAGVKNIIDETVRLKDWSGIPRHYKPERFGGNNYCDAWHDIKNDVFFSFSYEVLALTAAMLFRDISIACASEMRQWFKGGQTVAFVNPRKGVTYTPVQQSAERWQLREGKIVSMDDDVVTIASKGDRFRVGWNMIITCPDEALGKEVTADLKEAAKR